MLTVLVGENASGKTQYLRRMYEEYSAVISNMPDLPNGYCDFDDNRLRIFSAFVGGDVMCERGRLWIVDGIYTLSNKTGDIAALVCTKGDVLLLDEPDLLTHNEEDINDMYAFIRCMSSTFSEVYVATHRANLVYVEGARVATVDTGGNLVPVERKLIYEGLFTL